MSRLYSLVDSLKKLLFFVDGLTIKELVNFIQTKMLQDYSKIEVEKLIHSCLSSTNCFYSYDGYMWHVDKRGLEENDCSYNKLFKEQRPLRFNSFKKENKNKRTKKDNNKVIKLNINFVSDGRFIQHEGGKWGLTEWEIETNCFRLRHYVIKVLAKNNPEGLLLEEINDKVSIWKEFNINAIRDLLNKYIYFIKKESNWTYNRQLHSTYDQLIDNHIDLLRKHKQNSYKDKNELLKKSEKKDILINELTLAKEQTAAALAEQSKMMDEYETILQRNAEKDLVLSLRKQELIKCKNEKQKLENKSECILKECRAWVDRTRELEQENQEIKDINTSFSEKICFYEEKINKLNKEKNSLKEEYGYLKEKSAIEKANLIKENINLKQKIDKCSEHQKLMEKKLKLEISQLNADLKKLLQENEEKRRSLEINKNKLWELKTNYLKLKSNTEHPLVRISLKIVKIFSK